jgi:hypothetical protein
MNTDYTGARLRGCAHSVSRSASKMLRLVFDTAVLHSIRTWFVFYPCASVAICG